MVIQGTNPEDVEKQQPIIWWVTTEKGKRHNDDVENSIIKT